MTLGSFLSCSQEGFVVNLLLSLLQLSLLILFLLVSQL